MPIINGFDRQQIHFIDAFTDKLDLGKLGVTSFFLAYNTNLIHELNLLYILS